MDSASRLFRKLLSVKSALLGILGTVAQMLLLASAPAQAGTLELKQSRWLVLVSRSTLSEAIEEARSLQLADLIVRTDKGIYAVVFGPVKPDIDLEANRDLGIPKDAFLTRGKSFETVVWPTCRGCFIQVATAVWNDSDGEAHTAAAVGFGDSYDEANYQALQRCSTKGSKCRLPTMGSWNGDCLYVSLGSSSSHAGWGSASTKEDAIKVCRSNGSGLSCDAPVGACSNKFVK